MDIIHDSPVIPEGLCQCGCGSKTSIAKYSVKGGQTKGHPVRFIQGHRIRRSLSTRFFEKMLKRSPEECWEWHGATARHGYGVISDGEHLLVASRVAWELASGAPIPVGLDVLHHCDNPACCNPSHLFLGTATDNMLDMLAKGRGVIGSKCYNAKLTEDQVLAIRARIAAGDTQLALAKCYWVHRGTILAIVHRRSWKHL